VFNREIILTAIDLRQNFRGKRDFDDVGHYPDVFPAACQ
jgi:hypothetical protein